jgi:hypothetical protein
MKRKIALSTIIFIMSVLLVACRGENENNDNAQNNDTVEKNNIVELELNKSVDSTNVQFTLTQIGDFVDNYITNAKGRYEGITKEGYSFIQVHYSVKNIGNADFTNTPAIVNMVYDEDYTFSADKVWYYSPDCLNLETKTKGAWVNSIPTLGAFDDATECFSVFQIPNQIKDGAESLKIIVSFENDDKEYIYQIR